MVGRLLPLVLTVNLLMSISALDSASSSRVFLYVYLLPAIEHCWKFISFLVSVPVLSEKSILIWPNSSFKLEVFTTHCWSVSFSYRSMSHSMNMLPMTRCSSMVTYSEMGIK